MQQQITSPGVFTNEGESSFILRASIGAKGQQPTIPKAQPTPILGRMLDQVIRVPNNINKTLKQVEQGGTSPNKFEFSPSFSGTTPTPIGFTPQQGGTTPAPTDVDIEQGSVVIKPFSFIPERTSPVTIAPFGVFYHASTTKIQQVQPIEPKIGTAVNKVEFTPTQGQSEVGVFDFNPEQGSTTARPIGFTPQQGSTTVAIGQQDLSVTRQVAVPTRTRFRTGISLKDRFNQPNLGSTTHLAQYILSDQNTGYLSINPSSTIALQVPALPRFEQPQIEQGSTAVTRFTFEPQQGGQLPRPIGFTPEQGSTIPTPIGFTPNQGHITVGQFEFTPTQGETSPTVPQFTPEQGGVTSTVFEFEPTQGQTDAEPITFVPTQGQTDVEPFDFDPQQGETSPNLFLFEPQQGSTDPTPIEVTPEQGGTTPTPIGFTPDQGSTTPTPIGFTPEQGSTAPQPFVFNPTRDAPILNVLRYEADRLLALTLPRVKHGSETIIPFDFEPTTRVPREVSPPPQTDIGTQASALEASDPYKSSGDVGGVGKYRTLAYGELQRAPRATLNPIINTGTVSTQGAQDVTFDSDFVDLIINDIRFRAYITSFSDNLQASWNDLQYIGRQDVLKTFKSVTRTVSLGFKTAAFTKSDLAAMYQKLSNLANKSVTGRISENYIVAPFTTITIGKWFVKSPCVVNSIKFDTQPTEYSWDVGSTRQRFNGVETPPSPSPEGLSDEEADSRQLPMIVDVSLDLAMLGDARGNTWQGDNAIFA